MSKDRNSYLDILKAVTILFVVIGHAIQYGGGMENLSGGYFLYNPVFIFIYSFHMPLFMIVSGYLFAFSCKNKTWIQLLIAKAKQILIPLFCWSCVSLVVEIIKIIIGISSHKFSIIWIGQTVTSGFLHGPWFLWAIWWSSLLVIITRRFFKDNILVYLAVFILVMLIPDNNNSAQYKFMLPYFVLAYLFNKYEFKTKLTNVYVNVTLAISTTLIYILLLPHFGFDSYIYMSGYSVIGKNLTYQLHNNAFRFVIGAVGSISVMYAVYLLTFKLPASVKRPIAYVGTNTLGIYLISNYFFDEVLKRLPIPGINPWYVLIEVVTVFTASLLLTLLLRKFKTTNRLFLGGR